MFEDEVVVFLYDFGVEESGFDQFVKVGYEMFGFIIFIIFGEKEVCVWMICKGEKVFEVVGEIYFDFECGFICVEVIEWQKMVEVGGWVFVKVKGWVCIEGKDYVMQDGDIMNVLYNM